MRTFIAIDLDEGIKKELAALVEELRPLGKNVRWVNPSGMHLTLKFLGETSAPQFQDACGALEQVIGRHPAFSLALKSTGVFPPGRRDPRVLWVGVEDNPNLIALQADVELGLEKLGWEKEKREYHPHLTIGRLRFPSHLAVLMAEFGKSRARSFGGMSVSRVAFFQSVLKPSGAEYSILAEFQLI
jgi:2'-5' RNA ligase